MLQQHHDTHYDSDELASERVLLPESEEQDAHEELKTEEVLKQEQWRPIAQGLKDVLGRCVLCSAYSDSGCCYTDAVRKDNVTSGQHNETTAFRRNEDLSLVIRTRSTPRRSW